MSTRIPAEVFPPGDIIREELEAREWTQGDLAEILGRPLQAVNEIVTGKKAITPETAQGLGEAFGTGPELWLNLESTYRLSLVRPGRDDVALKSRLFDKVPVKELVKRNWIPGSKDARVLEQQVLSFLGIASLDEEPRLGAAARKSTSYEERSVSETAWLVRVRQLAAGIEVASFDPEKVEECSLELRRLAYVDSDLRHVSELLAKYGIRFVVVEPLSRTRIDGATLWLDGSSPIIALSLRHDRIDCFWFTLLHELAHVINGDGRDVVMLDNDLVGKQAIRTSDKPPVEQEADRFASGLLVAEKEIVSFIRCVRPYYSKKKIIQFAHRIEIHPGIVVGQLQHREEIGFSHSREMLVKVRETAIGNAIADGWGGASQV